jgi:hypothetical protein
MMGFVSSLNDLVIFFLLALSLMVIRKSTAASAGVIAFALMLKLFPVFAAAVLLKPPFSFLSHHPETSKRNNRQCL